MPMNFSENDIERIVRDTLTKMATPAPAMVSTPLPTAPAGIPLQARAAVLVQKEKLELRQFQLRAIRPDEILVRVEACGICGTDIHCFKSDPFNLCPVVLGHEGTGEVIQVGSAIRMDSVGKPVHVGDRVVTSTMDAPAACMIAKYNPDKTNLCDAWGFTVCCRMSRTIISMAILASI